MRQCTFTLSLDGDIVVRNGQNIGLAGFGIFPMLFRYWLTDVDNLYLVAFSLLLTPTQCKKIRNATGSYSSTLAASTQKGKPINFITGPVHSTCDWSKIIRGLVGVDPNSKAKKIL